MFSFFRKKSPIATPGDATALPTVTPTAIPEPTQTAAEPPAPRQGWLDKLKAGLRKTASSIATVFTGTQIDDALYEELETALLMADTGVKATEHLLADLKRRVKDTKTIDPAAVKGLLADAMTDLLRPLEKALAIGEHKPTVIMVAGVNGAGKTRKPCWPPWSEPGAPRPARWVPSWRCAKPAPWWARSLGAASKTI